MKKIIQISVFLSILSVSLTILYVGLYDAPPSNDNPLPAHGYLFLVRNLILSWIPFILTIAIRESLYRLKQHRQPTKILTGLLGLCWLLFLPNTFYMMTDWINLDTMSFLSTHHTNGINPDIKPWLIFSSFTLSIWTSMLLGIFSLGTIQNIITKYKGIWVGRVSMTFIIMLCSFAIYLGRFLRLYSWSVIREPAYLFNIVIRHLTLDTALLTLLYTVVIFSIYICFYPFLMDKVDSEVP